MVKQDIFKMGQYGYAAFRLPALLFNNGVFLAICEGRYGVADSSVAEIVLKRGTLNGSKVSWGDLQVVAKKENVRLYNPVPVIDHEKNTIFVVYKMVVEEGRAVMLTKSKDNGKTWSEPRDITKEVFRNMPAKITGFTGGPGHGIQLKSGRLVVQGCCVIEDGSNDAAHATVLLSDDHGESWFFGGIVPSETEDGKIVSTNETSAVELANDTICLNSRTLVKGQPRAQSFSHDGGKTFGKPQLVQKLIEPRNYGKDDPAGCEGALLGFESSDGSSQPLVLFSNPACGFIRLRMSIRLSKDGCKTWSRPWVIHYFGSGYSDMTKYQHIDNNNDTDPLFNPNSGLNFAILYESGFSNSCANLTFQTFGFSDVSSGIRSLCSYCCCSCSC